MKNKQEILEDAYEALANNIKYCNEKTKEEASFLGSQGDIIRHSNLYAETAYYLSQVIKVLENK